MKVSVVIPAYNEEAYIEKTLRAALAQRWDDFEVIVVDNNSTDATAARVREFPGVILLAEERQGVQYARERGRAEARGEIIANLDADCVPSPEWIGTAVGYFNDKNISALSGPYEYHDIAPLFRVATLFLQRVCFTPLQTLSRPVAGRGAMMMGGNAFIRAAALEKIGGYNTAIPFYGDDTDTANRLSAIGRVVYTKKIMVQSSARRFKRLGAGATIWNYAINYIWVTLFQKPYHATLPDES